MKKESEYNELFSKFSALLFENQKLNEIIEIYERYITLTHEERTKESN